MKNGLDEQYIDLLKDILENGIEKQTRNGKTLSVFGRSIRYKFKDGKFPLLTTKKMAWKGVVSELLWFLTDQTNISFLLKHNNHIWDGDAYKGYEAQCVTHSVDPMSKEQFISAIKLGNNNQPHFIPDLTGYKLGDLGPIYGKQWRSWKRYRKVEDTEHKETLHIIDYIDQIQTLINELKTNPDSRRLMVNAWNVGELDQMVLPPCHYGFQVYTRELTGEERWDLLKKEVGDDIFNSWVNDLVPFNGGLSEELQSYNIPKRAISLMFNMRSTDVGLGLGFNLASYGLLLMMIAKQVNMVPDELIYNGGDVHLYKNHIEPIKEQLNREPYPLPIVKLSDRVVNDIADYTLDDIVLENYKSHPTIKMPLSN
jgi:thymidylate synthase